MLFPATLLVAPAGFGKSVALRDFLETAGIGAVRYDVRREDGALLAFVRRLSEALEPVAPSAIAAFPAMQERVLAAHEPVRQLSDWFAEHLKNAACTIVIDDLHYAATDPASIALLADLIERTSERIKWILAARSDVGLPVATWIAYGRMDIPIGEDELRFTTDEALAAANAAHSDIELQEVEALRQLTDGWPVALTIALRTRTYSADLRSASSGTRELVYRYLAEQVFSGLNAAQRQFVLATAVFSAFDVGLAEALGASPEFLRDVRSRVAFLNETAPGQYRYHDLFRDFLETELRRSSEREWHAALCKGAELLERRGSQAEALALFVKAQDAENVLRIIKQSGFALFELGHGEVLASALAMLPEAVHGSEAAVLGLQAMIDASLGRFELAEANFLAAIERAGERIDLRMGLVHRYTIELVRNERDCVPFLEPYAEDQTIPAHLRVPLLGTLATGLLHSGRNGDAIAAIDEALRLMGPEVSDETRARVFQQAAYVQRYAGSIERARHFAEIAVELALQNNLYELAARAYSVAYTIEHDEADDPGASLETLSKISECAKKSASSRARVFALIASYEIQVDRGDDAALERLDAEIEENQANLRLISTALLPAKAMRTAWNGDFAGAHGLLRGSSTDEPSPEWQALRSAEIALYAAAAGVQQESEEAITLAVSALEKADPRRRRSIRTRVLLALAELVRGHHSAAHRYIADAERGLESRMHRVRSLAQAVRAVYRAALQQADEHELAEALERLRSEHFGGMARLLQALPLGEVSSAGVAVLTPAEREVLQLLALGASTKQVAAKTGRSPHTVDTHIRSICRKLGCSGRREAVALATSQGWVQT